MQYVNNAPRRPEASRNSRSPIVRMESSFLKNSLAIRSTRFFLKFTGFWIWKDERNKRFLDAIMVYTIIAVIVPNSIVAVDLWFCRRDFQQAAFVASTVITGIIVIIKLGIFFVRRDAFISLIKFCHKNFWERTYDPFGKSILQACERRCVFFVLTFTYFANSTVFAYLLRPALYVLENKGKNETDRILPFNLRLSLPVTTTPYYEIAYCVEAFSTIHVGICYFCFDNFLCIMNVHIVGQFRILQRKFELLCYVAGFEDSSDPFPETNINGDEIQPTRELASPADQQRELKKCVQEHQSLLGFIKMIEEVYTTVILGQVLLFSVLICLVSYQAVLANGLFSTRLIFIVHSFGTFTQLFMFTLTCDDMIQESQGVADAVYRAYWYYELSNPVCRNLSKDLMIVMMRSRRPCCLTAGGFFPVSLETFTTILSTAVSYLTLLRQHQDTELNQ